MLKKWGLRALVTATATMVLFLAAAFALQVPAVGKSIGSPQACGTCHSMTYEVVTLSKSAHRDLACLDCHAATGLFEKPVEEIKSASVHLYVTLTNTMPDVIKPTHKSREIVQENCLRCHAGLNETVHASQVKTDRLCFDCHRATPHGTPLRN
ncbi:MAG TPA: hypothetical protein VD969_24225 [Symbiobacteriaceae bacterium]|nr:hypothetical protein [Symbiobacteriaceae bacterium]